MSVLKKGRLIMEKILFLGLSLILIIFLFVSLAYNINAESHKKIKFTLPEAYPEDLVPLTDNHIINYSGNCEKENYHEIILKYHTDINTSDAVQFYSEKLEADILKIEEMLGDYVITAKAQNIDIKIRVLEKALDENYPTLVYIILKGDFKAPSFTADESVELDLSRANNHLKRAANLPEDYPLQMLPIISSSEITAVEKHDFNGDQVLIIQFYTKIEKSAVNKFYENLLKNNVLREKAQFLANGLNYYLVGNVDKYRLQYTIFDLYYGSSDYSTVVNLGIKNLD